MIRYLVVLSSTLVVILGCTPSLTPPGESIRISGAVQNQVTAPLEIEVYERCSAHLYVFKKCPGRRVGAARIARPGPFLVEIDARSDEVTVVAYRGVAGQEESCAVEHRQIESASDPFELALASGTCPIRLPEPIQASARAPVSGF